MKIDIFRRENARQRCLFSLALIAFPFLLLANIPILANSLVPARYLNLLSTDLDAFDLATDPDPGNFFVHPNMPINAGCPFDTYKIFSDATSSTDCLTLEQHYPGRRILFVSANDSACDDAGTGSAETPFCTVAPFTVDPETGYANSFLKPGDIVVLTNGYYQSIYLRGNTSGARGTADLPITIMAKPGDHVTIGAFRLYQTRYIEVLGSEVPIEFSNFSDPEVFGTCFRIEESRDIRLSRHKYQSCRGALRHNDSSIRITGSHVEADHIQIADGRSVEDGGIENSRAFMVTSRFRGTSWGPEDTTGPSFRNVIVTNDADSQGAGAYGKHLGNSNWVFEYETLLNFSPLYQDMVILDSTRGVTGGPAIFSIHPTTQIHNVLVTDTVGAGVAIMKRDAGGPYLIGAENYTSFTSIGANVCAYIEYEGYAGASASNSANDRVELANEGGIMDKFICVQQAHHTAPILRFSNRSNTLLDNADGFDYSNQWSIADSGACVYHPTRPVTIEYFGDTRTLAQWQQLGRFTNIVEQDPLIVDGVPTNPNCIEFGWKPTGADGVTEPVVPAPVVALRPIGNIQTATPTYQWEHSPMATHYDLRIYDGGVGAQVHKVRYFTDDICDDGVCTVVPADLTINHSRNHFWRARAGNVAGNSAWSDRARFSYLPPLPQRVEPIAPIGTVDSATPTFAWTADPGATEYQLWIYDRLLRQVVLKEYFAAPTICDSVRCSVKPAELQISYSKNHLWKVRGMNAAGRGQWSQRGLFHYTDAPPSKPVITAPTANTTDSTPLLAWQPIANATTYKVRVYDQSNRQTVALTTHDANDICNLESCSIEHNETILLPGDYFLRVRARNSGGWGDWSASSLFSVVDLPTAAPQLQAARVGSTRSIEYAAQYPPGVNWSQMRVWPNGASSSVLEQEKAQSFAGEYQAAPGISFVRITARYWTDAGVSEVASIVVDLTD